MKTDVTVMADGKKELRAEELENITGGKLGSTRRRTGIPVKCPYCGHGFQSSVMKETYTCQNCNQEFEDGHDLMQIKD